MPGFDGRMFLTQAEYETYMRRMPVRYIKKKHSEVCAVCGLEGTPNNPLQHSHRIGFQQGIKKFGLTPDFLDELSNVVSAHRAACNAKAELSDSEVLRWLTANGHKLPDYLTPSNTQTAPATPSTATRRAAPCGRDTGCQV